MLTVLWVEYMVCFSMGLRLAWDYDSVFVTGGYCLFSDKLLKTEQIFGERLAICAKAVDIQVYHDGTSNKRAKVHVVTGKK